jgi:GH15 family glucan-1,4-alpha-glucosidase
VFGAILDDDKGGRFLIQPDGDGVQNRQLYFPDTNVLITRFLSSDGVGEIADFMPVYPLRTGSRTEARTEAPTHQLMRHVKVVRGTMTFRLHCQPAFDYARATHDTQLVPHGAIFRHETLSLGLATSIPLQRHADGVTATFSLHAGQIVTFVLSEVDPGQPGLTCISETEAEQAFANTVDFWHRWLSKCNYRGRWREMVNRSALVLKLLTFAPTGAIVAAPTCSLPEGIGGERNWDYRYTWIRDASFTLYGFMRIGFTDEAPTTPAPMERRRSRTGNGLAPACLSMSAIWALARPTIARWRWSRHLLPCC